LNNPGNHLFDLLPPLRDAAIIGRLRLVHLLPVLRTRIPPNMFTDHLYIADSRFDPLPAKVKMNHLPL